MKRLLIPLVAIFAADQDPPGWVVGSQAVGVMAGIGLAGLATWLPLRAGARALDVMEF